MIALTWNQTCNETSKRQQKMLVNISETLKKESERHDIEILFPYFPPACVNGTE
jgi:hypothetical protein